jgi:hypothetical protein
MGRDRGRPLPPERLPRGDRAAGPLGFDRPAAAESNPAPLAAPALDTPPVQFQFEPPTSRDAERGPERHLAPEAERDFAPEREPEPAPAPAPARLPRAAPFATAPGPRRPDRPRAAAPALQPPIPADGDEASGERGATAPQLRRFIKSRAYVPMHELRRRFLINGGDDEVTPIELDRHRVFVGLPEREGRLLGELLRGGDIGYELSLDPISPIVVGVYPMRPVTRA